jgi:hypothetical protein
MFFAKQRKFITGTAGKSLRKPLRCSTDGKPGITLGSPKGVGVGYYV